MPKNTHSQMWWIALIPLIIVVAIVGIAIVPLAFIWALNTLFNLNIAYNFYTWLAALIIVGVLHHTGVGKMCCRRKD